MTAARSPFPTGGRRYVGALVGRVWGRPARAPAAAVAAAWAALAWHAVSDVLWLGTPGGGPVGHATAGIATRPATLGPLGVHGLESVPLGHWVLMTVAMMGPAALAGVSHTAANSLHWRRRRAVCEFAAAYLAVWTAFGTVALWVVRAVGARPSVALLGATLAAAAAWQLTPLKRRWLRDCHRSVPLPPSGWPAERAALTFGFRHGVACLGSCWCLMLVMVAAPSGHLAWMSLLTCIVVGERIAERPVRASRRGAVCLAAAALAVIAV